MVERVISHYSSSCSTTELARRFRIIKEELVDLSRLLRGSCNHYLFTYVEPLLDAFVWLGNDAGSKGGEFEGSRGRRRVHGRVAAPRDVQVNFRAAYEATKLGIGDRSNLFRSSQRDLEISPANNKTNCRVSLARFRDQFC